MHLIAIILAFIASILFYTAGFFFGYSKGSEDLEVLEMSYNAEWNSELQRIIEDINIIKIDGNWNPAVQAGMDKSINVIEGYRKVIDINEK